MAILDAEPYIRCKQCNSPEFRIETRGLLKENSSSYIFEGTKAIVCCKCNTVHNAINSHLDEIVMKINK